LCLRRQESGGKRKVVEAQKGRKMVKLGKKDGAS